MDVDASLKLPEFGWLKKEIDAIDKILTKKVKDAKSPQEMRMSRAKNIIPIIVSIEKYVRSHEPWKDLGKQKLDATVDSIKNYIYEKLWKEWPDEELREKDEKAFEHMQILSSVMSPENIGLLESITQSPLLSNAIEVIQGLDMPASPMKKLEVIHKAYGVLENIAKEIKQMIISDSLISFFSWLLIHSNLETVGTNIEFIWTFTDEKMRNVELFCFFTGFSVAY